MKTFFAFLLAVFHAVSGSRSLSQTSDLGRGALFSGPVDSDCQTLDYFFVFEPDETHISSWFSNLRMSVGETDNGYDGSGAPSFNRLSTSLWVRRNGDEPTEEAGWLLVRAVGRTFPSANSGWRENELPLQWLAEYPDGEVPARGNQETVSRAAVFTTAGSHTLQNQALIPESASVVMIGFAGAFTVFFRRRSSSRLWFNLP